MEQNDEFICTDDSIAPDQIEWQKKFCPQWPKKGETYTLREWRDNDGIVDGYLMNELINPPCFVIKFNKTMEPAFATWRFKRLQNQPPQSVAIEEEVEEFDTIKIN
jgi:hypothetical protein